MNLNLFNYKEEEDNILHLKLIINVKFMQLSKNLLIEFSLLNKN